MFDEQVSVRIQTIGKDSGRVRTITAMNCKEFTVDTPGDEESYELFPDYRVFGWRKPREMIITIKLAPDDEGRFGTLRIDD